MTSVTAPGNRGLFDGSPLVNFLSSSQDARMRAPYRAILMSIAAFIGAGWVGKVGSAFAESRHFYFALTSSCTQSEILSSIDRIQSIPSPSVG